MEDFTTREYNVSLNKESSGKFLQNSKGAKITGL